MQVTIMFVCRRKVIMILFRVLFVVLVLNHFLFAKEYSILLFTTKIVYPKDKELFLKRFPKGVIKKYSKYYEFKIEPFKSYALANHDLEKAKRYYKDAFIINFTKEVTVSSPLIKAVKKDDIKTIKKIVTDEIKKEKPKQVATKILLNEPSLEDKYYHKQITHIYKADNRPKIDEPKILENYEIPKKYKTIDSQKYDILGFKRYIDTLFHSNEQIKEIFYKKRIDYILSEIKKDRYGFDVYANGYLRTGSSISAQSGNAPNVNGDYTGAGISINANKLLYDGGYSLINHTYDILYKRLADIDKLNAKDKLLILGSTIYSNLYVSQEELRIFRKIYNKQKNVTKIIKQGYMQGRNTPLDLIDSKNDLLNLQRSILSLEYRYLNDDYILRHSIKSKSKKPYRLYKQKFKLNLESLSLLQKEAIVHSGVVARESNLLKIKQTDLLFQKKRRYPQLRFHSYLGYGLSTNKIFTLDSPGNGAFWEVGINLKLPIYNRNDINLNEQKQMLNVLRQKSLLSSKQRAILIQVEKSYNEISRIQKEIDILKEQLSLLKQKLEIARTRYLNGVSPYRDYSDAVKGFLTYGNQLIKARQKYKQEILVLGIIVGKRDIYE